MLNGEYIQRKASPPTRDQIFNDPRFFSVKANVTEFAGANILSKAIYTGLQGNLKTFKDSYFTSRLTGCCRKIIQKGRGINGQREGDVFNSPEALIGFQLHKKQIFNQIYTAKIAVLVNSDRSLITLKIKNSSHLHLNKHPKSATHFKLTAALSLVSAIKCNPKTIKYQPVHPLLNALGNTVQTPPLECKMEHTEISLQLNTPTTKPLPSNVAITVWLGIHFGKISNNTFTPFITAKAMECIAVS